MGGRVRVGLGKPVDLLTVGIGDDERHGSDLERPGRGRQLGDRERDREDQQHGNARNAEHRPAEPPDTADSAVFPDEVPDRKPHCGEMQGDQLPTEPLDDSLHDDRCDQGQRHPTALESSREQDRHEHGQRHDGQLKGLEGPHPERR